MQSAWLVFLSFLLFPAFIPPTLGTKPPNPTDPKKAIYITLEEHWVPPALKPLFFSNPISQYLGGPDFLTAIQEVGPIRLSNMTTHRIRRQIVSVAAISPAQQPSNLSLIPLIREANNQLYSRIQLHPDRFSGFAYLPMSFPDQAAQELERCVKKLGFLGVLVDHRLPNGTYFDGPAYRPFWKKAAKLNVPVYLHPTFPNTKTWTEPGQPYAPSPDDSFSPQTATRLATVAWGWNQDVGLHFLRLYSAGIFDEFPNLKIILGHMGEVVPFMLHRSDSFLSGLNTSRLSLVETYHRNVWITTSGFFNLGPLATVLKVTKPDRVMYSVDYPFGNSARGEKFMEELRRSGMVSEREWEGIAYRNAERLFKFRN